MRFIAVIAMVGLLMFTPPPAVAQQQGQQEDICVMVNGIDVCALIALGLSAALIAVLISQAGRDNTTFPIQPVSP